MDQARTDFMDFAMIGDAEAHLEDGILNLRIDLRPRPAPSESPSRDQPTAQSGGSTDPSGR
jgi:hypothetical protein